MSCLFWNSQNLLGGKASFSLIIVMKTWITYLTAVFLGLATALLLGDAGWLISVLGSLYDLAISTGTLLAVLMIIICLPSAVASLRKDRLGGKTVSSSLLWAVATAFLLPIFASLIAGAFPVMFPVSSTAGSGTISQNYVSTVFANAYQITFSGDLSYIISAAQSFLLPLIIAAFITGLALKPNADVIKPAYICMNSMSEVMYRISRGISYFGHILIYLTSCYFFAITYQEKTFFVDAAFSLSLVMIPVFLSLVLLPVLYEIFTKGKGNPYKVLYRNIAAQSAALTSGNYVFSMPFIMAGERYNDGVQKRISSSSVPFFYLLARGGSAAVAAFSVIALITNVTGTAVSLSVCLAIGLAAGVCSFACSLSLGFEIMFITVASMKMLGISLYSAEVTMLGMLPLLSGLGMILDTQIAILGANIAAKKAGVDITPSYKDIL